MHTALVDYTYNYNPMASTSGVIGGLVGYILTVVALWPVFTKAGKPGWGAIIPIYNTYLLIKIAGYHGATILLYVIPIVNIIWGIVVAVGVGRAFGKGGAFSFFLLWLLSIIGFFIIGYGRSRYLGPGNRPDDAPVAA